MGRREDRSVAFLKEVAALRGVDATADGFWQGSIDPIGPGFEARLAARARRNRDDDAT